MSFFSRIRTPLLQNTGSTARDHLASERTYLAWVRTGLGFIALGIAVERFSQLDLENLVKELRPSISPAPTPAPTSSAPVSASSASGISSTDLSSSSTSPLSSSSSSDPNTTKPNKHSQTSNIHYHNQHQTHKKSHHVHEDIDNDIETEDAHAKEQALVAALLGTGSGSIIYGTARYFSNLRLLESGMIKPAYHGAAILSVSVAGMAGAAYWNTLRHGMKREEKREREREMKRERERRG